MSVQPQKIADMKQLKQRLEQLSRDKPFLANYVDEVERHSNEEYVFLYFGLQKIPTRGPRHPDGHYHASEVYDRLRPLEQTQLIHWWHKLVRSEAKQFVDLRVRLSKLA